MHVSIKSLSAPCVLANLLSVSPLPSYLYAEAHSPHVHLPLSVFPSDVSSVRHYQWGGGGMRGVSNGPMGGL